MTLPTPTSLASGSIPQRKARRAALLNYFSLFSSFSTLICCALPSVLVLLGMGTAVASLLSAAPWLVSLSRHKIWTFSIAGTLIAASFVMTYVIVPRLRIGENCDADDPATCGEVSKVSRLVLWGSALIWSGGFFVAYLLGPILERIDR
jgi:hypothetical protein